MSPLSEVHGIENGGSESLNEHINLDISVEDLTDKSSTEAASNHGLYNDTMLAKISELLKPNSLKSTSTKSLFHVVNEILDDTVEKKSGDIPQRVASLIKLTLQEIEQRVSNQAENLRKQSSLYKSREEKYKSKIRALETLTMGTSEENEIVMSHLQRIKIEKAKIEEERKIEEENLLRLKRERSNYESEISSLKKDLDMVKKSSEEKFLQWEKQCKEIKNESEKKIKELEFLLFNSMEKVKELEDFSESKVQRWRKKEHGYNQFIVSHLGSIQELKMVSEAMKNEVLKTKRIYAEELNNFEVEVKGLVYAAQNYHTVLEENRKLYNEVQDLKGNIRVYCRIRPFLPGQSKKQTTLEYIGDNGELVVANPLKRGKDTHRLFKFNKVFGPTVTQEDVFRDTQPLIRSVLDGYNVCIFAYGQTGSGKTYTMTGPNLSSVKDWGVNYRALNDLFNISQSRKSSIAYEVGVQMVEIYNEQVRDLLSNQTSQKRLGIWNTTQPNGLAVPDASMLPVNSTSDVLELMNIGLMNRAVGATALNERSSRSHSVLTVHVRGTDLETNIILRGCLHLVDLAGSERVDRSEATGERLREAQHINKSLSALGDVISALAQKNSHVPYRNSKLTQLLQSSLGGQAKTLMFVQLNPDVASYSETVSTLKFAERVSGVELGAARSNKEGRGVRELMEQVALLKDQIAKKDDENGRLRQLRINSSGTGTVTPGRRLSLVGPGPGPTRDMDNSEEYSDKEGSQNSNDEFRHHKEFFRQSRLAVIQGGENINVNEEEKEEEEKVNEDVDLLGFGDNNDSEERLSDISDGVLSMGTETDVSVNSIVELTLFPDTGKQVVENIEKTAKLPKLQQKQVQTGSSRSSLHKSSSKISSSKITSFGSSSTSRSSSKRWQ